MPIIPESEYVESVPLVVTVDPEDGEIVNVGPYRHAVIWKEGPSGINYCNNCGSSLVRQGKLKPDYDPKERTVKACATCGVFQGYQE
jgi:hypothetical protein